MQCLHEPCHAGCGFEVAHVAFHRTDQQRMARAAALADCHTQGVCFDWIAHCSAGAVRFDVIDVVRLDIGARINFFEQRTLCRRTRYRQAGFTAIGVNARIRNDGQNMIAVGDCGVVILQEKNAATFRAHIAIAIGIEYIAMATAGKHRRFGKTDETERVDMQAHAPGERLYRFA